MIPPNNSCPFIILTKENLVISSKSCNFAEKIKMEDLNMAKITREEAIRRWKAAKATKKAMIEKMQKMLYEDYKARTGEEPVKFNIL